MKKTEHQTLNITPLDIPASVSMSDIFAQYADDEWAMLLDSANTEHQDGRYDILVAEPLATITTKNNQSTISHQLNQQQQVSTDNPLDILQTLLTQYMPKPPPSLPKNNLPFMAGALGFFGYDLGRQFEHLPSPKEDNYHTPDMAVGIYSWSVIKDNHQSQFYLCSVSPYTHPDINNLLHVTPKSMEDTFSLTGSWVSNMSPEQYQQKIAAIHQYLRAGDCYQINLAQRFSAEYTGNEWHAYKKLREANQAPFSAFLRLPDSCILSISPERFIAVDNNKKVQTKPIKGTRPRSQNPTKDQQNIDTLQGSEKDRAENLMIVDLLRNDLSKHCEPNTVHVPDLFKIESFKAVHHLVSTVTGNLKKQSSALNLLQGAFPGGSITGAPKIRAMQIIDELEPDKRNIYCGSIGYLGIFGDMDTSICIRTLLCEAKATNNEIHCWAGGGIVVDSIAEEEYQESLDKVSKILPILR